MQAILREDRMTNSAFSFINPFRKRYEAVHRRSVRLYNFLIASKITETFRFGLKLTKELRECGGVYRCGHVKIKGEFKIAVRDRPAFQFCNIDAKLIKSGEHLKQSSGLVWYSEHDARLIAAWINLGFLGNANKACEISAINPE